MLDGDVLDRDPDAEDVIERPALEFSRPYLYPGQLAAIFDPHRYSVIEASTKAGKAQPLDALVYTPTGPRRMGDIQPGDNVLTPSGRCRVREVHPQGIREILRVTFSDGAVVEADADHLWEVHQFRQKPCIVTTEELQSWPRWKLSRTWVPKIAPADFDHQPVLLDPYLVGALIGDGNLTSDSVMFSNADSEILDSVRAALPAGHSLRYQAQHDWRITGGRGAAVLREAKTHIRGIIERLGLGGKGSHEKFIPPCYRYNTAAVRLAVLQGILDTDGFVDKHRQPGIEQTSSRLAADIEEIVQSLGGTVLTRLRAVNGYRDKEGRFIQCRPVYRQVIRMPDARAVFRLERKQVLCQPKLKSGNRMFRSIEFSRNAEAQCLELDDDRALYLTNGLVPTHNTSGCIVWIIEQALAGEDGWNYWWVAPVSGQADIAFRRALRALPQDMATAHMTLKTITLVNGAIIWFKSGDKPDSLYGDDVHAAVVDEASRLKEDAWFAVRSTLTHTRGPVRIIGNVKGRRNWFYRLARRAEQEGGTAAMAYHKLTAYHAIAAGVLDVEEVEDARSVLPDHVFRALYLAEPSDDDGNPFGLKAIAACVAPLSIAPPRCWGWDLAKKQDFTVGIALDLSGTTCRFERWQRIPWGDTMERIIRFTGRIPALVDSTGLGDPIVDMLQKKPGTRFEGYQFTAPSKQKLMEGLAVAIQSKTVRYPDGPIRRELEEFEYNYTKTGVRYSAPEGFFDDCVMALALAEYHKLHTKPPLVISDDVLTRSGVPQARLS